ncbi:Peptidyl-Lys metalloendopeptidase [Rhizoctonia solani]|uniref:Peptidyl-Lys metalloendopeptidase n=1 Tax=Rhizoctonia solani TaxID=456999 RepID=A0A0K6FPT5_9AGAM|nr:Peptidyl-Lys metalloendopeptidase [Rhizoctonia solani]
MRAMLTVTLAAAAIFGVSASPGLSLSLITPESVTADCDCQEHWYRDGGTPSVLPVKGDLLISPGSGSPEATVKKNNAASFTTLAPGQTFEITHNLGGIYNFNNTGAGNFKLDAVSNVFQYIDASGNLATIEASTESKNVGLTVESSHSLAASSYLNGGVNPGTTRYTTWFGTYDSDRAPTVRSHFPLIGTGASSTSYDCSTCAVDAMGYVYANDPSRIYLCGSFWSAATTGTDSQAGTIVHELSHFTVNGGTEDHVYSQTLAKKLAKSNPRPGHHERR